MSQLPDYERGYRDALKKAVTTLHQEANTMNEAHAKGIWNSAAHLIGCVLRDRKTQP